MARGYGSGGMRNAIRRRITLTLASSLFAGAAGCAPTESARPPVVVSAAGDDATPPSPPSDIIRLRWSARPATGDPTAERMEVSLEVGRERLVIGDLAGASDGEESGKPEGCSILPSGTTIRSSFGCGGTPFYNYYTAELRRGVLEITLTEGVYEEAGSERVRVVKQIPTRGVRLRVADFVP